jgi:hypothetical protein
MEEQETMHRQHAYIVYHKLMQTTRMYLHDCTAVPPLAILLFGGSNHINHNRHTKGQKQSKQTVDVCVQDWIHITVTELHAVLLKKLNWGISLAAK